MSQPLTTFSKLMESIQGGSSTAQDELIGLVYEQLHFLASNYLRQESTPPSIQATELINEAWLRLFGKGLPEFDNRSHFFVVAARQMRRILIDRARGAQAQRRIPKTLLTPIHEAQNIGLRPTDYWLALEEALNRLSQELPRAAEVVELRYFMGLTEQQTAEILGLSISTVKREWTFAKTWLYDFLYTNELIAKK